MLIPARWRAFPLCDRRYSVRRSNNNFLKVLLMQSSSLMIVSWEQTGPYEEELHINQGLYFVFNQEACSRL